MLRENKALRRELDSARALVSAVRKRGRREVKTALWPKMLDLDAPMREEDEQRCSK